MKQRLFFLIAIFIMALFSSSLFAQTIIDVPSQIDGDPLGALNKTIMGDTTATGERAHPDAIYRLKRGDVYVLDSRLKVDFNFTLIASDDDGTRPPMLARSVDAEGKALSGFIEVNGDSLKVTIKNIIFQGVKFDQDAYDRMSAVILKGDNSKYIIDGCIFNGIGSQNLHVSHTHNGVFYIENCVFSNGLRSNRPWSGYLASFRSDVDTLIMRNNTYFNGSGYVFMNLRNLFGYVEYDHNTIFLNSISSSWMPYLKNAKFTNNLIYGDLFIGQFQFEWEGGYWGPGGKHGIITLTDLDSLMIADYGLTEAGRKVDVLNNVYEWPQEFKDWYPTVDTAGGLKQELWMSAHTDSMFNDDANYPYLNAENNIQADPEFVDGNMKNETVATALAFSKEYRQYAAALENSTDRYYPGTGNRFDLPWPLPENFAYSNATVLTHAQGGFPVGDLNWFPEQKTQWEAWRLTGVEKDKSSDAIPTNYKLSQNYPNPFNPTTMINFSIPKASNVELSVFNVLGQKVATLVNKELSAGSYKYNFDASNLTSGIYFYKLQADNYSEIHKMMLLK